MATLVEQGLDYLTREHRRLQNLLLGKVNSYFHAYSMMILAMLMLRDDFCFWSISEKLFTIFIH